MFRRLYQGVVASVKSADIHPELTLEQIQNPPDNRRGVLRSVGSRYAAVLARVVTKCFFCDFAKYEIERN